MKIGSQAMINQNNQTNASPSSEKTDKTDFLSIMAELEKEFRESPFADPEKKVEEEELRKEMKALENSLKTGNNIS